MKEAGILDLSNLSQTRAIYYTDAYISHFEASILKKSNLAKTKPELSLIKLHSIQKEAVNRETPECSKSSLIWFCEFETLFTRKAS